MTGPDPAAKKPARSTSSRAKTTTPAPVAASAADPGPLMDAADAAEPVNVVPEVDATSPVAAAPAAAAPPAVAPAAVAAAAEPPPVTPAAQPAPAPEPAPTPEPAPATASEPLAPAAAAGASGQASAAKGLTTPDIAGAVDKAVDRLRTHLTVGEIVAGLGAVIILGISWLTFGFIFGHYGTWPNGLVMLLSITLLAALVLQNAHVHDFGPNYRVIVAGICFALGILAALSFLQEFRLLFNGRSFDIGGLTWWAGAWISVIGGFLVWREGR